MDAFLHTFSRFRFLLILMVFITAACNPLVSRQKGAPVSKSQRPGEQPGQEPQKSFPVRSFSESEKIGTPELQRNAKQQANQVGENAELGMNKNQFQFGTSVGDTHSPTPPPYADAEGQVHSKSGDPSTDRIIPSEPHPNTHS